MSDFRLTSEQKDSIVHARHGGNMAITAVAGSGKTLTLSGIAASDQRSGIYLVYNRRMKEDIQGRLPPHVRAMTGHSLAFNAVIGSSYDYRMKFESARDGRTIPMRTVVENTDCLALAPLTTKQAAALILDTINQFQYSADLELSGHHVPIEKISAKIRAQMDEASLRYIQETACDASQAIWSKMVEEASDFPILHDTYVKILQLRQPEFSVPRYLCDEYQVNPVLASMISGQRGQKIFVGDPQQQIYGWRGSINALEALSKEEDVASFKLTKNSEKPLNSFMGREAL